MDYDSTTAFAQHFKDSSFELYPGAQWNESATLFISFFPEDRSLNMAVYSYGPKSYSHQFLSTDPAAVGPWIADVEATYGIKVPASFRQLSEEFLTQLPEALGVSVSLQREPYSCEYCGPSRDELAAFYYPALTPDGSASLGISLSGGCFGGPSAYGAPEDAGEAALDILEQALAQSDLEDSLSSLRSFQQDLKRVLKASGTGVSS